VVCDENPLAPIDDSEFELSGRTLEIRIDLFQGTFRLRPTLLQMADDLTKTLYTCLELDVLHCHPITAGAELTTTPF